MDPINIIVLLNLIATFGANMPGAKKGLKSTVTPVKEKPETYLQWLPVIFSTLTLLLLILAVFRVGTLGYTDEFFNARITGLVIYIIFSWVQIWAYTSLGENYSQNILIYRNHSLVTKGPFKFIRHPQYLSQIMLDLGAGLATLSFLIIPIAILQIPFLILRAVKEDKLLEKHFGENFRNYKKKTGLVFPFIG